MAVISLLDLPWQIQVSTSISRVEIAVERHGAADDIKQAVRRNVPKSTVSQYLNVFLVENCRIALKIEKLRQTALQKV